MGSDDSNVQRTLGEFGASIRNLERGFDRFSVGFEKREEAASDYRSEIRKTLDAINNKVDPLVTNLDALRMQVQAHEVVIKNYETRRVELQGAQRLGQWLIHAAWVLTAGFALIWGDRIKFPIQKLMSLFAGKP